MRYSATNLLSIYLIGSQSFVRSETNGIVTNEIKSMQNQFHEGKILATKVNRLAPREAGIHLQSKTYAEKLDASLVQTNRFDAEIVDRNLKKIDESQHALADFFRAVGSKVDQLPKEEARRDLQVESTRGETDLMSSCVFDTDALIKENPTLEEAINTYFSSYEFSSYYDPTDGLTYMSIFFDQGEDVLHEACANVGGYWDVNTGLLVCEQGTWIRFFDRYTSCLANTQECRAKRNFEYLEVEAENAGWTCESEDPTMSATYAPTSVIYDNCTLQTDMMLNDNPDLYSASIVYFDSGAFGDPDPVTGHVNISFSDTAEEDLRQQCVLAGGYFDINLGNLTCDLPSDLNATATVIRYVSCFTNIPDCRLKDNYEYLKVSMENWGFSNCRTSVSGASNETLSLLNHNATGTNGLSGRSNKDNRRGLLFGDISHKSIFPRTPHDMVDQDNMIGMNHGRFDSAFPGGPIIGEKKDETKAPGKDVVTNRTVEITMEKPNNSDSGSAPTSNLRPNSIRSAGSGVTTGFAVLGAVIVAMALLA